MTKKIASPLPNKDSSLFSYDTNTSDSGYPLNTIPMNKYTNPVAIAQRAEEKAQQDIQKLVLTKASSEPPLPEKWLYPNWLEQGELTVLFGDPSVGKTNLTCALAAGVSRGEGFELSPGLVSQGDGFVIFVNREDKSELRLRPRLMAAGANMDRIRFIEKDTGFSFSSEEDLNRLEGHSKLFNNNIGLIVIDPIYHAVNGDYRNEYKARQAYEGLATLARRLNCAILGISHTTSKTIGKSPLNRLDGPPAIKQVPRAAMLLSMIAHGPTERGGTRVLIHAKNNNGTTDGGFECRIDAVDLPDQTVYGPQPKITITGELMGSADELIRDADRLTQAERGTKTKFAEEFLRTILANGSKYRLDIEPLAIKAGITIGTLMLAYANLKVVAVKGEKGRSKWSLPISNGESDNQHDLNVDPTELI